MAREFKDSGIEWIGQIPKEWEIVPFKAYFTTGKGLSFTKADLTPQGHAVVSYGQVHSKVNTGTRLDDNLLRYIPDSITENGDASRMNKGDFIFADTSEDLDGCGNCVYVDRDIELYAGYHSVTAKPKVQYDNKYFAYYFQTPCWRSQIRSRVTGIKVYSISQSIINKTFIFVPPLSTQQKIADYLDKTCGEVDEMVALQETMIEELKAYKQSVITEAVTKGQNPNAPMRDSGIDWIGEIPEHWEIAKMKFLCTYIKDGTHFSPEIVNDGYPYITATDVRGIGLNYDMAKKVSKETFIELQKVGCQPRKGDVLLVKDGATTGRTGLMVDDTECVLLSSVAMLRPNKSVCQLYLMYLLMSDMMQSQIQLSMAGTALPRITLTKLTNFLGIIPPFEEQQQIVSYLDTKCSEIDSLIALKQAKIEELKEYKKSVIYEYVTGKKEVV